MKTLIVHLKESLLDADFDIGDSDVHPLVAPFKNASRTTYSK